MTAEDGLKGGKELIARDQKNYSCNDCWWLWRCFVWCDCSLLAKVKDNPLAASILSVYFSGIAGGLAYKRVSLHMVATDLIEELANAMKPYDLVKKKY